MDYEMKPFHVVGRCPIDGTEMVATCDPCDAQGWAIYRRTEGGPAEWVSDHDTRRGAAKRLAELKSEAGLV